MIRTKQNSWRFVTSYNVYKQCKWLYLPLRKRTLEVDEQSKHQQSGRISWIQPEHHRLTEERGERRVRGDRKSRGDSEDRGDRRMLLWVIKNVAFNDRMLCDPMWCEMCISTYYVQYNCSWDEMRWYEWNMLLWQSLLSTNSTFESCVRELNITTWIGTWYHTESIRNEWSTVVDCERHQGEDRSGGVCALLVDFVFVIIIKNTEYRRWRWETDLPQWKAASTLNVILHVASTLRFPMYTVDI